MLCRTAARRWRLLRAHRAVNCVHCITAACAPFSRSAFLPSFHSYLRLAFLISSVFISLRSTTPNGATERRERERERERALRRIRTQHHAAKQCGRPLDEGDPGRDERTLRLTVNTAFRASSSKFHFPLSGGPSSFAAEATAALPSLPSLRQLFALVIPAGF